MAELVNVRQVTSDEPHTSQKESSPGGSIAEKGETLSPNDKDVKLFTAECTEVQLKDDLLDHASSRRHLAWPSLIAFDGELFADKKHQFMMKAMRTYRRRLLCKNVATLSVAILLVQTSLYNMADLRTVLQPSALQENLTYYAIVVLALLLLAPCITAKLGTKLAIVVGLSFCLGYVVCHVYVHLTTMIMAHVLLGLGSGVLWTALGCYLTKVASYLSVINGTSNEDSIYGVFGCFYLIYHLATVWNRLTTAHTLHGEEYSANNLERNDEDVACGAFYCPTQPANDTQQRTGTTNTAKVYAFYGVSIILCLLSILTVILCVSKLKWQRKEDTSNLQIEVIEAEEKVIGEASPKKTDCSELWILSSCYQIANRQQLVLLPITLYSGLQESFYLHHFTQSYIACSYGYRVIVITSVINGAMTSISSVVISQITKKTGRIPLFVVGAFIHCAVLLTMFVWHPNSGPVYGHFIISSVWGVGNAICQCLLHGFYGVLFLDKNKEAAFANFYLWRKVGFMMAFICNYYLCNYVKIFTLISVLTLGMIGYFAVEVPLYRQSRS